MTLVAGLTRTWTFLSFEMVQASYAVWVGLRLSYILLHMNKEKFNSLPAKAQEIFISKLEYTGNLWASQMDEDLGKHFKKVQNDPKHNVYFPTPAETAEWKKVLGPAIEAWMKDDPKREKLLKAYKEEVASAK